MENEKWYEAALTEEERLYDESVKSVRDAVLKNKLSFEEASARIGVKDEAFMSSVLDDALKVLIAEMHFSGGKSLDETAAALKLPLEKLRKAKAEMLKDVEDAAIDAYKTSLGKAGNA